MLSTSGATSSGKRLRHAPDLAALNGVQIVADRPQRAKTQPELQPGEQDEDGGDRNQDARHVPSESLPQFHDLLVVERDSEAEGTRGRCSPSIVTSRSTT